MAPGRVPITDVAALDSPAELPALVSDASQRAKTASKPRQIHRRRGWWLGTSCRSIRRW